MKRAELFYALVTSYFEPIPGHERDTFWCKNQSLLHFFELGIWCLLCFLSMNYSLIFKGCWKLFRREKNPDLVVFRRFKSGLSVLHFNLCWYWSDFRFNALWESHQIRVTWSAKTQLSLNPDSQRKEIARWPGTGSRFRLFESHIFLGEMFFLYTEVWFFEVDCWVCLEERFLFPWIQIQTQFHPQALSFCRSDWDLVFLVTGYLKFQGNCFCGRRFFYIEPITGPILWERFFWAGVFSPQ